MGGRYSQNSEIIMGWNGGPEKVNKSSGYRGFKGIGAKRVHGKCRFSVNNESWKLIFSSN
jgi:hypothetical protein